MLEKKSEWLLPENLEKLEISSREAGASPTGDFRSYKLLNNGITTNNNLEFHNCLGMAAKMFAKSLKTIIVKHKISANLIADMGAGAGFVAKEVSTILPNSKIYTYEISHDAVSYTKKSFPQLNAFQMTITPESTFTEQFDLVYAKEFYPFTRTNSYEFQRNYIHNFIKYLRPNGAVVIALLTTPRCLLNNYSDLKNDFPNLIKELSPSTSIYRWIPSLRLAQALTFCLNLIRRRKGAYFLIFKNN